MMEQFSLEKVLGVTDYTQRKTKIVCTIGFFSLFLIFVHGILDLHAPQLKLCVK